MTGNTITLFILQLEYLQAIFTKLKRILSYHICTTFPGKNLPYKAKLSKCALNSSKAKLIPKFQNNSSPFHLLDLLTFTNKR